MILSRDEKGGFGRTVSRVQTEPGDLNMIILKPIDASKII